MLLLRVLAALAACWLVATLVVYMLQRRAERWVDQKVAATRQLAGILEEAEWGQYVPLPEVDKGHMRSIPANRFIEPPPGEGVVMVGDYVACQHTISLLHLNPQRVTVAEYPWRLFNLPPGMRVIILPSALELPQIDGVLTNLRTLGNARYVRVVI